MNCPIVATDNGAPRSYPPLAEVRERLKVGWYRCPSEPALLRQLMQRSDLQGWLQAGGHLLVVAARDQHDE